MYDTYAARRQWLRRIARIAVHSYSIYLWHMPVKRSLSLVRKSVVPLPWAVEFVAFLSLAIGLGVALSLLVEQPVLRLRDRFFPSRSGGSL